MEIEKYRDKGLTGLANLGNTCYLNSCMQVLSHCYDFNNHLEKINPERDLNNIVDSHILKEWCKLKELMWSKNCTIAPNRFVAYVRKISLEKHIELFTGFAQNDLPEFLIFIVDCFHNSLKKNVNMKIEGNVENSLDILAKKCFEMIKNMYSDNYSEIIKLFFGIQVSLIHNPVNNKNLSVTPEPFSLLNLPLAKNSGVCSIYECFDLYTEKEYLEGDNAWLNEDTNHKENVNKCFMFWSLPKILIIDFKRFNNFNKKLNTKVETPVIGLDLSKYVVGYDKDSYIYELFGICNHSGNSSGGHYTSFVKNANNKWYHFNDTNVTEISENNLITEKGYCYFYRKL